MANHPCSLLQPLRRDRQRDFVSGGGSGLLRAKVLQALMTRGSHGGAGGELPWRTDFGASLGLLRHQRNGEALAELARVYVRDCLRAWVPEVELLSVEARQQENALTLKVRFRPATGSGQAEEVSVDL